MGGFPEGSDGKELIYNEGDLGLIPGWGRSPGGGHGNPLQDSCLENRHGQRSLVGYSPRGHKERDKTEQLSPDIAQDYRKMHVLNPPFFFFLTIDLISWASLVAQLVKNPPAMQETPV